MRCIKNLKVTSDICFIYDGEEIEIFDLENNEALNLSCRETAEFFRDTPFKQSLDITEYGVCPKVDTNITATYNDNWNDIELQVLSDDGKYLVTLSIGCHNILANLDAFKNATCLDSEMVM